MLIGKCVVTDWLVVEWERSAKTGKQRLLTISSWKIFEDICMGKDGQGN